MATGLQLARVLGAIVLASLPALAALAQSGGIEWADVDCAQSRIWPTMGLHCRTTAELTDDSLSKTRGHFRFWNASGSVEDVKYYYYVVEAVNPGKGIVSKQDVADALRSRSPQARGSFEMSDIRQRQDADVVSFQSAAQEACIGIRKLGPGNPQGTRWVLYATRCVPPGHSVSEADIDAFVRLARLRE